MCSFVDWWMRKWMRRLIGRKLGRSRLGLSSMLREAECLLGVYYADMMVYGRISCRQIMHEELQHGGRWLWRERASRIFYEEISILDRKIRTDKLSNIPG